MPVVLEQVVIIDLRSDAVGPTLVSRCDACGASLRSETPGVRIRNRCGPPAVRTAWLCRACLDRAAAHDETAITTASTTAEETNG